MSLRNLGFAALAAFCFVTASAHAVEATPSLQPQQAAEGDLAGTLDDTQYWSTEGTGSCSTGTLTCASTSRQIGCQATGEYVKCEYTAGDVGWVRCIARGGGTTSAYSDRCP